MTNTEVAKELIFACLMVSFAIVIAVVSIIGNGTVLMSLAHRKCLMKSKNIYIANLAATDFGIGLFIPMAIVEQVSR